MPQRTRDEIVNECLEIATRLQVVRDNYLKNHQPGLFYKTLSLYIADFCVRYPLLLHDLVDSSLSQESENEPVYKAFVKIQGNSRYLLEEFFMICHLLNFSVEKRETGCLSLRLSELLHMHKQDKTINEILLNSNTNEKIISNNKAYKNILLLAEEIGINDMPEYIDDCSPTIIKSKGLKYYPSAKIDYKSECETNPVVKIALNKVSRDFGSMAQPLYALFSFHEHPTYFSLERINNFIKLERSAKIESINNQKFQALSLIRPIAKATLLSLDDL